MRRLLVCLCVCSVIMLGQAVSAAIAYVQQAAAGETGAGDGVIAVAYPSNVTAGNLLVVVVRWGNAVSFTSLVDTLGNTWQQDAALVWDTAESVETRVYSAIANSSGANTVTFTVSAPQRIGVIVHEFSGSFSACRVDQTNTNESLTGTAIDSGNVTTTVADALLFGATGYAGSGTPVTVGTGYSNLIEETTMRHAAESKIVSGTVTDSADFTIDTSEPWGAMVLAFSEAACASGGAKSLLLMGVG